MQLFYFSSHLLLISSFMESGVVSALVAEYDGVDVLSNPGAYDDLLEHLLSALAQLPDLATTLSTDGTTCAVIPSPVHVAQEHRSVRGQSDGVPNGMDHSVMANLTDALWKALSGEDELLSSAVTDAAGGIQSNECDIKEWKLGMNLASRLCVHLSPTELHATSKSSFDFGEGPTFQLVCLFLACRALWGCTDGTVAKRYKRWRCMQMETMALFQRCIRIHRSNPAKQSWAVTVWCHVLPAVATVQQSLVACAAVDQSQDLMLYEAATIACASHIALQVYRSESPLDTSSLQLVWRVLCKHVLHGRWELLYEHPLRKQYRSAANNFASRETKALARLTIQTFGDNDDDEHWDLTVGVDTVWSDVGIALLAVLAGWIIRPMAWSIGYQWCLVLPHVNQLLVEGEEDNEGDSADESLQMSGSSSRKANVKAFGFETLNQLLLQTPQCTIHRPHRCWQTVVGLMQLLSNHLMAVSIQSRDEEENLVARHVYATTHPLPTATETFQQMKTVMSRIHPLNQTDMVRKLLEECPHPGLRPKLIDLLRIFVRWNDELCEDKVWVLLEEALLREFDNQHVVHSPKDFSGDSDAVEEYQALLALLQLWIMCKQRLPVSKSLTNLIARLEHAHDVVAAAVSLSHSPHDGTAENRGNVSSSDSDEHCEHRFNLLENSLQQIISLIQNVERPDHTST
jgi:hypothetical protein